MRAAILLAAGSSARLGQPKQLVVYKNETLVARSARLAHEAGIDHLFIVTGTHHDDIASLQPRNATLLYNPEHATGMASSIRRGIHALPRSVEQVLLLTCDQPAVSASHLKTLFEAAATGQIAASQYADRPGIPAVFPRSSFAQLLTLTGDQGARLLLQNSQVLRIALPHGEFDIDTPDDLARLRSTVLPQTP